MADLCRSISNENDSPVDDEDLGLHEMIGQDRAGNHDVNAVTSVIQSISGVQVCSLVEVCFVLYDSRHQL